MLELNNQQNKNFKINKLGFIILICLFAFLLISCVPNDNNPKFMEKTEFVMGTVCQIKIYNNQDESLLTDSIGILKNIENLMSTRIESSEIYKFNQLKAKEFIELSDLTRDVVKMGIELTNLTDGYFDITLGSVVEIWGIGTDNQHIPDEKQITDALSNVGIANISLDGNKLTKLKDGTSLDLGAIAKGYAADEVCNYLKSKGVKSAIVNLGGNVKVIGKKPSATNKSDLDFKVGIQDPLKARNIYFGTIGLSGDETIVTSGDYERFFEENGIRYHHIIDKKTGAPARSDVSGIAVISNNSATADALSTALYVMGKDEGLKFVNTLENVECFYITHDKRIYSTTGVKEKLKISDNEFVLK